MPSLRARSTTFGRKHLRSPILRSARGVAAEATLSLTPPPSAPIMSLLRRSGATRHRVNKFE
jgi:hypothetical protein